MSKQRYVDTKFWDDNYILKLGPAEKLLFLYFLTNPLTNIAGIYEIALRRVSFDTGIDETMTANIINQFSKDKKIFYVEGWLIICNFTKHQNYEKSPKIRQGIDNLLKEIPKNILNSIDTLSIPYLYPTNYSNPNPNPNPNIIKESDKSHSSLQELVEPLKAQYGELLPDFLNYWTQKNANGKKELWQMQRVFDAPKRLATWKKKNEQWDKSPKYSSKEEQIAYECAKKFPTNGVSALFEFTRRMTKELGYTMDKADEISLQYENVMKF